MKMIPALWEPIVNKDQIKKGSLIKIVGISKKDSYRVINVKKVLKMRRRDGREWTEILINISKNYYFNLDAYLSGKPEWDKWVKELYVRKTNNPRQTEDDLIKTKGMSASERDRIAEVYFSKVINMEQLAEDERITCGTVRSILARYRKNNPGIKTPRKRYVETRQDKHALYSTWSGMKQRCSDVGSIGYRLYGGRGIKVCDKWRNDFWAFVEDMGPKPSKHTLDRIDNNKGYSPENCKWSTVTLQNVNQRRTKTRGTTYRKGRWQSKIRIQRRDYGIGSFSSQKEAHEAYMRVFKEWYGFTPKIEDN